MNHTSAAVALETPGTPGASRERETGDAPSAAMYVPLSGLHDVVVG